MTPLSSSKGEAIAVQYAALCWRRRAGEVQVLLVTSREQGRWVIPKGWPMKGRDPHKAAAREAWEEAGVRGKARPAPLGVYHYAKNRGEAGVVPCRVQVFELPVERLAQSWPEDSQRRRKWFAPQEAANRVQEPELRAILAGFAPERTRACALRAAQRALSLRQDNDGGGNDPL